MVGAQPVPEGVLKGYQLRLLRPAADNALAGIGRGKLPADILAGEQPVCLLLRAAHHT